MLMEACEWLWHVKLTSSAGQNLKKIKTKKSPSSFVNISPMITDYIIQKKGDELESII